MKKLHIFFYGFVLDDLSNVSVGGVQTYIINLSKVFQELGYEIHYYQPSSKNFQAVHYNIITHGYQCRKGNIRRRVIKTFNYFKQYIDKKNDIIIFAEEYLSCKAKEYHTIGLQHGIFWDIPDNSISQRPITLAFRFIKKMIQSIIRLAISTNFDLMVCVDYNYVNWYRAIMPCVKTQMVVIPNFTPIFPKVEKPSDVINIIFARRFDPKRGTRVFCAAIKRILKDYNNIHVTLAGWGIDEKWLRNQLQEFNNNVTFTTYKSEETFSIHADKHIAVVPTIGSEGTSLSLLEAMSSQCAVIASDVGGLTNILLDGYNGLIVPSGNEDALYTAIKKLIDYPEERCRLAETGYKTISDAFSFDIWRDKWIAAHNEFIKTMNC